MRLLVLGGTEFVGRTVVEAALARGWEVTVFHRGRHAPPPGVGGGGGGGPPPPPRGGRPPPRAGGGGGGGDSE
ncbi:NAD-dependent epimerase/dehydratase family protein, partial [Streptomyces sp. NPDC003278]|uniref:NAD-dependent epimerase/dehydratase family protein n=1 Tax=Streptomyces sp. NPDC003278 TaxID=3364679 RepID=UPI0036A88AC9